MIYNLYMAAILKYFQNNNHGSGGIWTHASEETGALNQRLRPLGHATFMQIRYDTAKFTSQFVPLETTVNDDALINC